MTNIETKKEVSVSRTFNAPIALVWEAWMEQKHVANWWGPKGFTNPVCEWNPHVGGNILIHMKAPDGVIYPMDGTFLEITKPEKIVFSGAALDKQDNRLFEQLTAISFKEVNGNTEITVRMTFSKVRPEAEMHLAGATMGWNQSFDKLAELLEKI